MEDQLSIIFYLLVVLGIIAVLIGHFLSPILLKFHVKVIGKNLSYGIQELKSQENYKRGLYAFLPALMAVSLSLMFADEQMILNLVVSRGSVETEALFAFLLLLPIMTFISLMIFSPIWILLESGIIYSNRKKVENKLRPEEITGVGNWYYRTLKGYVGIGVIIAYAQLIIRVLGSFESISSVLSAMIVLPLLPLMIILLLTPAMIIFESTIEYNRKKLVKVAKKLGIEQDINDLMRK